MPQGQPINIPLGAGQPDGLLQMLMSAANPAQGLAIQGIQAGAQALPEGIGGLLSSLEQQRQLAALDAFQRSPGPGQSGVKTSAKSAPTPGTPFSFLQPLEGALSPPPQQSR